MKAISAVVLPGLDGTGRMLDGFARVLGEELGENFHVRVIAYPPDKAWGYDQLLSFVAARLPSNPFILIGESFSGPLALRFAASPPPCLLGVVLGASFARIGGGAWGRGLRLAAAALALFPDRALVKNAGVAALCPLLLGRWATPVRRRQVQDAVAPVTMRTLRARARDAVAVDLIAEGVRLRRPALYLRATEDGLIPRSAAQGVEALAERVSVVDVEGPHFLFLAAPEDCAKAIRVFVNGLMSAV